MTESVKHENKSIFLYLSSFLPLFQSPCIMHSVCKFKAFYNDEEVKFSYENCTKICHFLIKNANKILEYRSIPDRNPWGTRKNPLPAPSVHPLCHSILAPSALGPPRAKLVPPRFHHAGYGHDRQASIFCFVQFHAHRYRSARWTDNRR